MANITSQFATLLAPGLMNVINQGFEQPADQIDLVFNVKTSVRAYEEEYGVTGLGLFTETAEMGPTSYDDRLARYLKRFTHLKYTLGVAISQEMYDDDLYGEMKNYGIELGRSAKESPQILAFNIFNRAFNSSYTGPDAKVLCATDHPLKGGGTQSNRPTVAADLSYNSLVQGEQDMLNWIDDRGKHVKFEPRVLFVPVGLKKKSWELTKSQYNPEVMERVDNYVANMGLQSMYSPYLTSAKAWFIMSAKQYHYLRFIWRKRFAVQMWEDFDRGALRARGEYRCSAGWSDYFGVYGSPGL